jgi:RNA polymerase sigma-70 factor (ECF subfamily)
MSLPDATGQSDEALMVRAQANDTSAFARLYDRHSTQAFQVARSVCHDTDRAEEIVQEGFLSIWRNRAKYQPESGSFQSWSMKIVRNQAIDLFRSTAVRPPPQLGPHNEEGPRADTVSSSPPDEAIARSESVALRASLRRLPATQAEVIALAYFGGLSHSEIATELALPKGTVKGRMRLGMEKLRNQMGISG